MIAVAVEMVLPGLIGLWIDQYVGTRFLLGVIGFGLGLTLGIWHLVRLTQPRGGTDEGNREHDV